MTQQVEKSPYIQTNTYQMVGGAAMPFLAVCTFFRIDIEPPFAAPSGQIVVETSANKFNAVPGYTYQFGGPVNVLRVTDSVGESVGITFGVGNIQAPSGNGGLTQNVNVTNPALAVYANSRFDNGFGLSIGSGVEITPYFGSETWAVYLKPGAGQYVTLTVQRASDGTPLYTLPFTDALGNGYASVTNEGVYFVDVTGLDASMSNAGDPVALILQAFGGAATVPFRSVTVSAGRNKPLKSMLYNAWDLGITPGVSTWAGTWVASPSLNTAGARAWSFAARIAAVGAQASTLFMSNRDAGAAFGDNLNDVMLAPTFTGTGQVTIRGTRTDASNDGGYVQVTGAASAVASGFSFPRPSIPAGKLAVCAVPVSGTPATITDASLLLTF